MSQRPWQQTLLLVSSSSLPSASGERVSSLRPSASALLLARPWIEPTTATAGRLAAPLRRARLRTGSGRAQIKHSKLIFKWSLIRPPPAYLRQRGVQLEDLPFSLHLAHADLAGQVHGGGGEALQGEAAVEVPLGAVPHLLEGELLYKQTDCGNTSENGEIF